MNFEANIKMNIYITYTPHLNSPTDNVNILLFLHTLSLTYEHTYTNAYKYINTQIYTNLHCHVILK